MGSHSIREIVTTAVDRVKSMTNLETVKHTISAIASKIRDGSVLKIFKDRKEFNKMMKPLVRRYRQLMAQFGFGARSAAKK